jgi:FemAB-related protein (PEP-CTERM system-associated)
MTEILAREFVSSDRAAWRAYLAGRGDATLFHDLRWADAVECGYGYQARRLVAERGGKIAGVLPLIFVDAPLLGRALVSTAFSVGGGILADDAAVAHALGAKAFDLGRALGVNYVELRGGARPGAPYIEKTGVYSTFEKELPGSADAIKAWLPRNRRAEIKKALRIDEPNENSFRTTSSVRDFYKVYAPAVRNLGTPVMPRKFLAALKDNFGDDVDIGLVEHEGEPVAGLMSFWFRDRVMPYYIGANRKARAIRAYDYLYYKLMRRATERGVRVFDFGRSKVGSTHHDTKTYWGFSPEPVIYFVALVRAKSLPNVNPANPKFAGLSRLWRRLPLPVANALGPVLARNFP